ncbi:hypothetical protein [Vogesella indigofera]|uniref:hypothetical protein n=1 Tax=Vogesella indigofera TaxID=45465 RepID=UPI00234E7316|nr:hypothetical protein [Vogesella indigofera]MDC7710054.1 hypothetical protein [Vogesella indigofera]
MNKPKSPLAAENFALLFGDDGLPHSIDYVDGDRTGLNAVALAIINAGFSGIRAQPLVGNLFLWQVSQGSLEGEFFRLVCHNVTQGRPAPSPELALRILSDLQKSEEEWSDEND